MTLRLLVALLSVAVMVAVCGLTLGVRDGAQSVIRELRSSVGETSWLVRQRDIAGVQPPALTGQPQRLRQLESAPGVVAVALFGRSSKTIGKTGYATAPVTASFFAARGLTLQRGRLFTAPGEAVVGAQLAEQLGQTVSDGLAQARVVGVLRSVGARGDIDRMTDRTVFMNADGFTGLSTVSDLIVRTTPERFVALQGVLQRWADRQAPGGYDVVPLADQYGTDLRRKAADLLSGALGFGVVACILAGLLNLGAFFLARSLDGLRALGVRRAVGATQAQVIREDLLRAMVWCVPGLLLGLPAAFALSGWAGRALDLPVRLGGVSALLLLLLTGLVVAVSAYLPARWAARQSPTLALRGVASALPRWQAVLTAAGLALGTAGLVVQANTAQAARAETERIIGRIPPGVATIAPTVIDGEAFTDPRGQLRLAPFMFEELRASPLWRDIVTSSVREVSALDVRGNLPGTLKLGLIEDPAALAQLSDATLTAGRWPRGPEVALGLNAAITLFGTEDVVGQPVTVPGVGRARVSGVFIAPQEGVTSGLRASDVVARQDGPYRGIGFFSLVFQTRQPETAQGLADLLNREFGREDVRPVGAILPLDFAPAVRGVLLQLGAVYRLLSGVLLLLGGVGLMAQLLLMLARRTREIGVRRAVGATRPDIYRQFMTESGGLGLGAALLGAAGGLLATFPVLRAQGVPWAVNPEAVVLALALGVGTALLFGALPAGLATRIPPAHALKESE